MSLTSHSPNSNHNAQSKLSPMVFEPERSSSSCVMNNVAFLEGGYQDASPSRRDRGSCFAALVDSIRYDTEASASAILDPDGGQVQAQNVNDQKGREARGVEEAIRLVDNGRNRDQNLDGVRDHDARPDIASEGTGVVSPVEEILDDTHLCGFGLWSGCCWIWRSWLLKDDRESRRDALRATRRRGERG